jgi:1,4-dihydroxy-2-naphthoate octaprenyltransferase
MENENKSRIKDWVLAARPRTLILAIACVGMGLFLAAADYPIDAVTAGLTVLTAALLQILSNLANDYGDTMHGADHGERIGPSRAVQSGRISPQTMRRAVIVVAATSVVLGFTLLWFAFGAEGLVAIAVFVLAGALAIWAAIAYTAGGLPYGYVGLGDLAVLTFFGWVAVVGSYFLQTHIFQLRILLPAASCGLFAVGVLNINNIRDMESDRQAGKQSIPVRLGLTRARIYHWILLLGSVVLALFYVLTDYSTFWQFLFLGSLPLVLQNGRVVATQPPARLDPYLGQLSLTTLVFVVLFGSGQILAG